MTPKNNTEKTKIAVQIAKLETTCEYTKKAIDKLETGQECILQKLTKIQEEVAINKTKLGIFAGVAGVGGGLIVTLIKILLQ